MRLGLPPVRRLSAMVMLKSTAPLPRSQAVIFHKRCLGSAWGGVEFAWC